MTYCINYPHRLEQHGWWNGQFIQYPKATKYIYDVNYWQSCHTESDYEFHRTLFCEEIHNGIPKKVP
jgi:hypothetical protein